MTTSSVSFKAHFPAIDISPSGLYQAILMCVPGDPKPKQVLIPYERFMIQPVGMMQPTVMSQPSPMYQTYPNLNYQGYSFLTPNELQKVIQQNAELQKQQQINNCNTPNGVKNVKSVAVGNNPKVVNSNQLQVEPARPAQHPDKPTTTSGSVASSSTTIQNKSNSPTKKI